MHALIKTDCFFSPFLTRSSNADKKFDTIIGCIEDIIMGKCQYFITGQRLIFCMDVRYDTVLFRCLEF